MERRYQLLSEAGVRNIAGYNKLVESAKGDARVLLEKKREAPRPKKAASLLVVDVGEGESEEEALARAKEESLGVPSPLAALEDPRRSLEARPRRPGARRRARNPPPRRSRRS
jgi:S-DNA-T family DNA segregation ATPase FtsK/SpoIIIE